MGVFINYTLEPCTKGRISAVTVIIAFMCLFFIEDSLAEDIIAPVCPDQSGLSERLELSIHYFQSSEFQRAADLLKDLETCPDTSSITDLLLFLRGEVLMALSPQEARVAYEKVLELCRLRHCSPLIIKKARYRLVEISLLNNSEYGISQLEGYVEAYPEEDHASYLLAYLKEREGKDAINIYKRLYIKNSPFSELFKDRINLNMLTHEEFEEKIKGLIRLVRYDEAEKSILERLKTEGDRLKIESLRKLLGNVYFKKKKYKESAEEFSFSKEYYLLGISYLRSGDYEKAKKVIEKLVNSGDRRVIPVAVAYARTLRDKGDYSGSLDYLKKILKYFPFDSEQIQWAIAWIHYRTGNYNEAKRILTLLQEKYNKARYTYWLLRIAELSNQKVEGLSSTAEQSSANDIYHSYRKLMEQESGFYSLLARQRYEKKYTEIKSAKVESLDLQTMAASFISENNGFKPPDTVNRRFSLFLKLGFKEELADEIGALLKNCIKTPQPLEFPMTLQEMSSRSDNSVILRISYPEQRDCREILRAAGLFFYTSGQYHRAVGLYSRLKTLPEMKERIDERFLYPIVYPDLILKISRIHSIDPYLLLSIMREESRYNPDAISPAGAVGLMQIMPYTAERLLRTGAVKNNRNSNQLLYDPEFNIQLGALYLRKLLDQYKEIPVAIAAYNAGEAVVDSWLKNGYSSMDEFIEDIPYGETQNYVKRVLTTYEMYLRLYAPK
ncbi:MAG: transglycosylase SLT domain-containing protein [Thermodesulfovibrionales bacterium]|nr:transglycosylase SLT domain-containing protein [Thermodesulfovibrionales bacterium]